MSLWPKRANSPAAQSNAFSQLGSLLPNYNSAQNSAIDQAVLHAMLQQQANISASARIASPQLKLSPEHPNTFGWRAWVWDIAGGVLRSPQQGTAWNGAELHCETWDESDVVRGVAGIHARLVPEAWRKVFMDEAPNAGRAYLDRSGGDLRACIAIQGIVERFGRYVLGTDGWRAEWVVIRKLAAPTDDLGLALERAFPDVEVVYGNR